MLKVKIVSARMGMLVFAGHTYLKIPFLTLRLKSYLFIYLFILFIYLFIYLFIFFFCFAFSLMKRLLVCNILVHVQGPVVQSVVSLTSSLRVISLTVLADSIYNILIFIAEKMSLAVTFVSAKNFSIFAYHSM